VKHTGQAYDVIERTLDRDYFMTADQAKEFGIIDRVLTSRDEVDFGAAEAKSAS
jgi:ATP-dependent Clp protease protease subunit